MPQWIGEPVGFANRFRPEIHHRDLIFERQSEEHVAIGKGNANYDAIFQFRDSFLTKQLRHSLSLKSYPLEKSYIYMDSYLSVSAKQMIDLIVDRVNEKARSQIGGGLAEDGFRPHAFRIRLLNPIISLTQNNPDIEARVDWTLSLDLRLVRGTDIATIGEYDFWDEPAASGSLYHYPSLQEDTAELDHRLWSQLDFSGCGWNLLSSDPLLSDLRDHGFVPSKSIDAAVQEVIAPLLSDVVRISPTLCLAGELLKGEQLAGGYHKYHVARTIRKQSQSGVLCLCVDATKNSGGAGLGLVRPFLGQNEFGWYFSQALMQSIVALRWARVGTVRDFVSEAQVPFQDPDDEKNTVYGKANVKWRWSGLVGAYVAHTPGSSGAIRLKTTGEITVLELWDHKDNKVEPADYPEFFKPTNKGQIIDFKLFDSTDDNSKDIVATLGGQLFVPLYRPTVSPLSLTRVTGIISGAVRGGIACGELSTEPV